MSSSFQENAKEVFKTIMLLAFYPFGCLLWIYLCRKHNVSGRKRFACYSVGGYTSWALAIFACVEAGSWRLAFGLAGFATYATFLVLFIKLSMAKVQEIEQRQQIHTPVFARDAT